MFSWFHSTDPEEPKKEEPFTISWYKKGGPLVTASGAWISATGLGFTTSHPPPEKEFNVQFEVREKTLHARVQSKKPQLVATPSGYQHKFDCKFTGIAADDWDRIVRYINGASEIGEGGSFYDPDKPDDDFRQLPTAVQEKIIEDLAAKQRLEAPPRGIAPLIRMTQQGEQRTKDGKRIRKFMIHSRIVIPGEEGPKDFDTRYSIDEAGNVVPQA